jgi:hypothetical protein
MRLIAAVLLGLYAYVVGMLTLGGSGAVVWAYGVTDRFYAMSQAQANVALFVPAGLLLAVVLLRPLLAAAVCLVWSAGIEWFQAEYLPWRVVDLNDVAHNGLGGLVGAVLAAPLVWVVGRSVRHRRRTLTSPPPPPPQPLRAA